MSSNDKTRQKLMDSMRKTKADANNNTPATEPEEKSKPTRAASKKKTVAAKKEAAQPAGQVHTDPYQSRHRRVWPD